MFFLGNLTQTDTDESNFTTENANAILGSYGKPPIVELTNYDQNDDGAILDDEDNPAGDYIGYDAGSGSTFQFVDSTVYYNADVLLGDGSTITLILMVIQTQNGDTFAVDLNGSDELENQSIQSITLNSVESDGYGGYWSSTSVNGASVVCFCVGTKIATPHGEVAVEALRVGDKVLTLDHGPQPVIWTNTTTILRPGHRAPITFASGSLGQGVPAQTLRVSPQHRLLLRSRIARRVQGSCEVLIAAKDLLRLRGATQGLPFVPTTYCHFACHNHEVVFANGIEAETFLLGPTAAKLLSARARSTLEDRQPSLEPARPILSGHKAHALVRRHIANQKPIRCDLAELAD